MTKASSGESGRRTADVQSVRVFIYGIEVGPEPGDYIVACAHRVPSFASKAWLRQSNWIYVLVALETGDCVGGPTVAGRLVRTKVSITYVPFST